MKRGLTHQSRLRLRAVSVPSPRLILSPARAAEGWLRQYAERDECMLRHHRRVFTTESTENTEGMRRKAVFLNYQIAFLRIPSVYSVNSVVNTRVP